MAKNLRIKPKPLKGFDFTLVQPQMKGLLINVDRDIHRQVKQAEQRNDLQTARQFVVMRMIQRVAINAYQAVIYVGAETPEDPNRKPTYILIVPPINRQLLDLLFTLVYMLDDYPARLIQI